VLCSLLEVTKALSAGRNSLSRQTVTAVVHRYSRTLIVPASLFRCRRCYLSPVRPYKVVVQDGQVISVMKNQSEPLLKVTTTLSTTRMDVDIGCCLGVAAARSAVWKRSKNPFDESLRLTKNEYKAMAELSMAGLLSPDDQTAGNVCSHPETVRWACGAIFLHSLRSPRRYGGREIGKTEGATAAMIPTWKRHSQWMALLLWSSCALWWPRAVAQSSTSAVPVGETP